MSELRAGVFDFGGVMARSPLGRMQWLAEQLDAPLTVVVSTIFGGHGDEHDNPWHDAERGQLGLGPEFGARMTARFARHGVRFDLDLFVEWVAGAVNEPEPAMVDLVRALRRAGIPTALLTNSVREFRPVIEATIPVDELFDVVVDSCVVGLRKPEARIYTLAAERLGVDPASCLFADDVAPNVAGAAEVGMVAVHVTDANAGAREIARLFGLTR